MSRGLGDVYKRQVQTTGARCGDGRTKGDWECPGSYTTDKCTVRASCAQLP